MRCTSPSNVGFKTDGSTLAWSPKQASKEYASFKLPCGKCLECRLEYARTWAIRCVHEAQMHEKNAFITLTYSDEHLPGPKLVYSDFQKFMKKLRKLSDSPVGVFVAGEYGEKTKRPHWHCIVFGWSPSDGVRKGTNHSGDILYESATLDRLWGKGLCDYGAVTFKSAGYVARYAAKKIVHSGGRIKGSDDHEYQPISKKSSKHAIGKRWLKEFWPDVLRSGSVVLQNGQEAPIPRYYLKWIQKNQPAGWLRYVTEMKQKKIEEASSRSEKENSEYMKVLHERRMRGNLSDAPTLEQRRKIITESKFKMLQEQLKL